MVTSRRSALTERGRDGDLEERGVGLTSRPGDVGVGHVSGAGANLLSQRRERRGEGLSRGGRATGRRGDGPLAG